MNLKKINVLVILAIVCVIISAGAVCAADSGNSNADDIYTAHDGHDGLIIPPDYAHDEIQHAAGGDSYLNESQNSHNATDLLHAAGHNETKMINQTGHVAGENITNSTGAGVSNQTANATAAHKLPVAGNPIVALLAVSAVLGGYAIIRRK